MLTQPTCARNQYLPTCQPFDGNLSQPKCSARFPQNNGGVVQYVEDSAPKWLCLRSIMDYSGQNMVKIHFWWGEDTVFLNISFNNGWQVLYDLPILAVRKLRIFVLTGSSDLVGSNPVAQMTLPSLDLIQLAHVWNTTVISGVCSKKVVTLYRFCFIQRFIQLPYLFCNFLFPLPSTFCYIRTT